jgi:hypothetical protein
MIFVSRIRYLCVWSRAYLSHLLNLKRAGAMVDMERLERQHTWNLSTNSICAGFHRKALTKCMFNFIESYIVMNVAAYRHIITTQPPAEV